MQRNLPIAKNEFNDDNLWPNETICIRDDSIRSRLDKRRLQRNGRIVKIRCFQADKKVIYSRVGTPTYDTDLHYFDNPDITINSNGMKLINWLKGKKDAFIVNGLVTDQKDFDSKFTFFHGNLRSQNDLLIFSSQNILESFTILNKLINSDHTPTCTIISVNPKCSLNLLYECSTGLLNYNH